MCLATSAVVIPGGSPHESRVNSARQAAGGRASLHDRGLWATRSGRPVSAK